MVLLRGYSKHSTSVALQLGSNIVVGDGMLLEVDGHPLLQLHLSNEKIIQLSTSLYNQEGRLLVEIQRNEWITGDPLPWDLEFGLRWIKVRERQQRISLVIDARVFPVSIRGHLWFRGHRFLINKAGITFAGTQANPKGEIQNLGLVAFKLSLNTADSSLNFIPDSTFGGGMFVSQPATIDRIVNSIKAWQQLKYPDLLPRNKKVA